MFKVIGKLDELGEIEDTDGVCEIVLTRVDGKKIRVTGLTKNEVQQVAKHWGDDVFITVAGV